MAESKLDITDELLVAYVDDELDPARRELVSSVLAANPALCRRADEMRLARDLLREAFPLRPDASIPPPIEAAANRLAEACAGHAAQPPSNSSFRNDASRARRSGRWKYAIAASLVACLAASAIYLSWRPGVEPSRVTALMRIGSDTPLHRVLEFTPSAKLIDIPAEDAAARAVLTFRAKDGRFCREFEILSGSGDGSAGIACREHGEWRAEVLVSAGAGPPSSSNFYAPAGQSDESAVAEVVDRLIQGDPLSAQEEARVLASGWRTSESP